jgi:flagellar assembly protein FliH
MAVIRGSVAASMLPDAIVLDLGDLARQGKALMDRAEAEAAAIVAQAKVERERLMSGASEQGYSEGRAAGFAQGLAEGKAEGRAEAIKQASKQAEEVMRAWMDAIERFERASEGILATSQKDVIAFAVRFAERITRRMVELDDRAVEPIMAEAIGMVMAGSSMTVRISPSDAKIAHELIGPLLDRIGATSDVHVVEDQSLAHGSCVVRTRSGVIDASVDTMIERMVQTLLPDGVSAGVDGQGAPGASAAPAGPEARTRGNAAPGGGAVADAGSAADADHAGSDGQERTA